MDRFTEALTLTQLINSAAFAKKQNILGASTYKRIEMEALVRLDELFPEGRSP